MSKECKVILENKEVSVVEGMTYLELLNTHGSENDLVVLAAVNGKLAELHKKVTEDCRVKFLDTRNKDGFRTYRRSMSMLLVKAARDVLGKDGFEDIKIQYSINEGYYCDMVPNNLTTEKNLKAVVKRMRELVEKDLPISKEIKKVREGIKIFQEQKMMDKVDLLKYRKASNINLYKIEDYYDYYYGYMVPSTGMLKYFDLHLLGEGFVLQLPTRKEPKTVAPFNPDIKLNEVLRDTTQWGEIMEVDNVGALNRTISRGEMNELVLVSEALMEKRIGKIADQIVADEKKKFVFIAGPSSSGKTTFAHRLCIQLKAHGIKTHAISVDNYFVNRELTPRDEDGNYDFETIKALDVEKFNEDMNDLIAGKNVNMPVFNFISGEREYHDKYLQIGNHDILVIEGIHCLNPEMSKSIDQDRIFKVYISALTQLNIDSHNRIPTTDSRLIRRIVRDNQYRGASAQKTISMWPSVRRGEGIHIFPYQEEADVMFNSALVYELALLKQYVEPLLYDVDEDSEEYLEAKRLIKFLGYFLGSSSEAVPYNSLIREFIGGSTFR